MSDASEPNTNCPDSEMLIRCVLGGLPPDQHASVTAHVDRCSRCQHAIQDLDFPRDEFVASLRHDIASDGFEDEEECLSSVARVEALQPGAPSSHDAPTLPTGGTDRQDAGRSPNGAAAGGQDNAEAPDDASPDHEQLGPYRLLEKLGAGGMGTVYKALHTKLDRVVAIKVLSKSRLNDADAVARFEREMKAVGRLQHPHIVHATDADEDDGVHYLVMEFVDGIDLSKLQRRLGRLPVAEACELVRQGAIGLQYVHEHGLVHRDIKPSNLMLAVSGQPSAIRERPSTVRARRSATQLPRPSGERAGERGHRQSSRFST